MGNSNRNYDNGYDERGGYYDDYEAEEALYEDSRRDYQYRRSVQNSPAGRTAAQAKRGLALRIAAIALLLVILVTNFATTYVFSKLDKIDYVAADEYGVTDTLSDEIISDSIISNVSESEYEVVENPEEIKEAQMVSATDNIVNIMLIGTDSKTMSKTRSDSMMIASINRDEHTVKLISFMRDSYVKIPDYKGKHFADQKMTHAFAYGGAQLLINTVEANFGVKIDYYVRINFTVMPKLVSNLGGVGMTLSSSEALFMNRWAKRGNYSPTLKKGNNWLNGNQALIYARCRDDSDYYRTKRQQKVIKAMASRLKECGASRFNKFVNAACSMVQTDMTKDEIMSYVADAAAYLNNLENMKQLTIPIKGTAKGKIINKMYQLVMDMDYNVQAIQDFIYKDKDISEETYTGGAFSVKLKDKSTTVSTDPSDMSSVESTSTSSTTTTTTSTTKSTTSSTSSTSSNAPSEVTESSSSTTTTTKAVVDPVSSNEGE